MGGVIAGLLPRRNGLRGIQSNRERVFRRGGEFSGRSFYFGGTASGEAVNEMTAMQNTAVYACVRILAESVAGLPLHVYGRTEDDGKRRMPEHPLYRVLHDEPNEEMTSFIFREAMMSHLLLWGT